MARTIRESINVLAGTTGKTLRDAYDALATKGAVVTAGEIVPKADIVTKAKVVTKAVTVTAAETSGTETVVAGSTILGIYPTSNQDQIIDSVAISDTTLTVTLAVAATADNVFNVVVLEA